MKDNNNKKNTSARQEHEFGPLYDCDSRILILGSFPSVKSRAEGFYYANPQNRFWKVIAAVTDEPVPGTVPDKKSLLAAHHIALWDVIESCDITGSSDSSIREALPADIPSLLKKTAIKAIYANGSTAFKLYGKYIEPLTGIESVLLPSTSPANASWRLERLIACWRDKICMMS